MPNDFSGIVRLFPLPSVVLFPGVIQALHIFEPRYRAMMEDAIESDSLISMALPKEGPDVQLQLSPDLHPNICIGKVITHTQLENGRYNLLLLGIKRARIIEELPGDKPFRRAKVQVLEDVYSASDSEMDAARDKLISEFRRRSKASGNIDEEMIANLSNPGLPFGMLVDLISFSMGVGVEFAQAMLETTDVWQRAKMVLEQAGIEPPPENRIKFPPDFSDN